LRVEYDLVRIGPNQLENMAVALCNAQLGVGGVSFGRGRDGGREWTFNGELPLPPVQGLGNANLPLSGAPQWDGYTVAQVKHKEFLEGSRENISWLLQQIQREVNC